MQPIMIRVLLVDDERLVRTGLSMIIGGEPDLLVVAVASDGAEAADLAARHRPEVVVMDVRMPGVDGIEGAERILALGAGAPAVLMLTTYRADESVRRALRAGASGYVLKDAAPAELAIAIRAVAEGRAWLDPTWLAICCPSWRGSPWRRPSRIDAALPSSPTGSVRS